jgi:hypothetical protein
MKDANDCDAVVGIAELDPMSFNIAATIARPNMIARRAD